jgi:predicted NBD/HSP70 family sugar kinase
MVKAGETVACSNWGCRCIERHVSAAEVTRMAEVGLRNAAQSAAHEMAQLVRADNKQASNIFDSARQTLAIAITGLIDTLNFALFSLGGGVCNSSDLLSYPRFRQVECRSYVYRSKEPELQEPAYRRERETYLLKAKLGSVAGLRGACVLALEFHAIATIVKEPFVHQ